MAIAKFQTLSMIQSPDSFCSSCFPAGLSSIVSKWKAQSLMSQCCFADGQACGCGEGSAGLSAAAISAQHGSACDEHV